MSRIVWTCFFIGSFSLNCFAAQVIVSPGLTLQNAVDNASDGDTLLLQDGVYSGNVTINKSLHIRAVNSIVNPIISMRDRGISPGFFSIDAEKVVLQGLIFDTDDGSRRQGAISCSGDGVYELIENRFLERVSSISCGSIGRVIAVGNMLEGVTMSINGSAAVIVAGNILIGGSITTNSITTWVIGNNIISENGGYLISSSGTQIRVVGNRLSSGLNGDTGTWQGIQCTNCLVAGNTLLVERNSGSAIGFEISGYSQVLNNTFMRTGIDIDDVTPALQGDGGVIAGNIFVGHQGDATIIAGNAQIRNNICFNNKVDCGTENGNLNVDPEFSNTTTFQLALDSPAIDAGPEDFHLSDLDRTRNDIGAYGGSWSIGQYDQQRESSSLAPYVFPLIDIPSALHGGNLNIKALGVAKLR